MRNRRNREDYSGEEQPQGLSFCESKAKTQAKQTEVTAFHRLQFESFNHDMIDSPQPIEYTAIHCKHSTKNRTFGSCSSLYRKVNAAFYVSIIHKNSRINRSAVW